MDSLHGHDAFLIDVDRLSDMVVDFRGRARAAAAGGEALEKVWVEQGHVAPRAREGEGRAASCSSRSARSGPSSSATTTRWCAWSGSPTGAARAFDEGGIDLDALARGARGGARRRSGRRRDRARAARPPRAPAAARARGSHRGRRHGGGVRAGVPPRRRRRRREQAAARDAAARGRAAPAAPPPAPSPLPLRHRRRREPARHRDAPPPRAQRRPREARGGLALGHARVPRHRARPRRAAVARDALGDGARLLRGGPARRPLRRATPRARRSSSPASWARTIALEDVRVEPFVRPELLAPGRPTRSSPRCAATTSRWPPRSSGSRSGGGRSATSRASRRAPTAASSSVSARRGGRREHAAARLVGVEAYVAFTTARHSERPLVVQGTGVGGAHTAGGVLAEIFRIPLGGGAR